MLESLWTLLVAAGVILGIPASIVTLVPPWRKQVWARLRGWLYKRSNRYRIDQLEQQIHNLPAQMEAYRKELEQVDAARQNVLKELARLHQSSEHPKDLTTTEELSQQIKQLQAQFADLYGTMVQAFWQILKIQTNTNNYQDNHYSLAEFKELIDKWATEPPEPKSDDAEQRALQDDLLEIEARRLISAHDPSPEAQHIIQAAKARRERKGISDLPALPGSSSAPPTLPTP